MELAFSYIRDMRGLALKMERVFCGNVRYSSIQANPSSLWDVLTGLCHWGLKWVLIFILVHASVKNLLQNGKFFIASQIVQITTLTPLQ